MLRSLAHLPDCLKELIRSMSYAAGSSDEQLIGPLIAELQSNNTQKTLTVAMSR